ncbi:MAG: DUF3047 domain-containing protein [Gammaproteobacteria bacterium]|nr:DUF3047 domain-containing protein [Gammaproteobacteria bacterium]
MPENGLRFIVLILFFLLMSLAAVAQEDLSQAVLPVGSFSAGSLAGWKNKSFQGETSCRLITDGQINVLKAESHAAASGLFFEQRIDLNKTPVMNWRWRVEQPLTGLNEQTKLGDDFAARVYVVVSGGLIFWNTKAINYVWANTTPKGKIWPNPFAGDHAMMVAVRSASDKTGQWFSEKRNVRENFKRLTGEDIHYIDAGALMTDTDNSSGQAVAYYGDIFFTAE